jgi:hypothetical protein
VVLTISYDVFIYLDCIMALCGKLPLLYVIYHIIVVIGGTGRGIDS